MLNAYLYDGLRTPFGRHAGALAKVRPDDLLAEIMKAVMKKSAFKPEQIEDIIVGCANQGGEDSRCVARHAGLVAGLPIEIPGIVLQRNCASGLGALVHAAHAITAGEGDVYMVGGVESMSRSPLVLSRSESPFARDVKLYDSTIGPRFSNPKLVNRFGDDQMPQTADTLAREYEIKREDADKFALASQQKYAIAKGEGFFAGEISPVELPPSRKGPVPPVADDEHPRPNTDLESLAKTRAMDVDLVLPGHGEPVTDHRKLIDDRFRMHDRRAEKLHRLIAERPRTAYELAQALWGNIAVTQAYLTLSEVLGHTDVLLNAGRVREVEDGGVVCFEAVE